MRRVVIRALLMPRRHAVAMLAPADDTPLIITLMLLMLLSATPR